MTRKEKKKEKGVGFTVDPLNVDMCMSVGTFAYGSGNIDANAQIHAMISWD